MKHVWPFVSSAHASTATATRLVFFVFWGALPPRCIFLPLLWFGASGRVGKSSHSSLTSNTTRRVVGQWAAQAAQVVRIIFCPAAVGAIAGRFDFALLLASVLRPLAALIF